VIPPAEPGRFHFVVVAAMRAKQLARGCVPRVEGDRPHAVLARIEVAEGKVAAVGEPFDAMLSVHDR
jgi:DNA-directed RNA polymerase subunit K/omega